MGTDEFTIEFWFYPTSIANDQYILTSATGTQAWSTMGFTFFTTKNGKIECRSSSGGSARGVTGASTNTFTVNAWNHVAAVKDVAAGRYYLYLNGVRNGGLTISFSGNQLEVFTIDPYVTAGGFGSGWNFGSRFNGYIDDIRITKGVCRYTSNFTPPTQPFIGKPIVGNDLYYYATSLLLKGDGTNGSTNIVDSSFDPKTITANGDAQISTAQSKFGGSSIAFDGAGDYISTPNNAAFDYGTSNFTIEFWYKFAATPGADQYIYSQRLDSNNFVYIYATGSSFVLYKFDGFGSLTLTGSTTHNTTTWSHLAAVRNGTTFTLYKDGTALNSITNNATFASLGVQLDIGIWSGPSPSLAFNGYIDDLRITKGIARYTSNFTPPGPLPTY